MRVGKCKKITFFLKLPTKPRKQRPVYDWKFFQKNGCWAIRNIVARSYEFRPKFAALGAETLLNESRRKFPKDLNYEARVTLRDLGCEIEDEYPWPKK